MIDSTVAHITDPQFKLKPTFLHQHEKAVNGKFYWVGPPEEYDSAWCCNETGEEWRWGTCVVDDFGVLVPVDVFTHDSDNDQHDGTVSWFIHGFDFGRDLEDEGRLRRVSEVFDSVHIVDEFLNCYRVDKSLATSVTEVALHCWQPGPWGHMKSKLVFSEIPNCNMHYLVW